ncbi:nuclear transport factor 2 family protein [Brevundimonas sp. M20]|uniref:nuclear transport factor 2 family protein n=1 Tax=Brevundimonas sp. M20 TaxID=2591463 RepID=UPI0011477D8B|nr:nuclear transport factor 2 family protein [Brevundimonas sp. M20]QDH73568.1 nuclear transport factor 2 family protein [Brevundimonas sp. M20]
MSPELPSPIADYVEANARLDLDGMMKSFAADAVFLDNGKRFEGHAEIRALLEEMVVGLKAIFSPDAVRHEGQAVVVEGPAHGEFPGSPIRFTYRVELDGDAIRTMEVSA